MAEGTGTFQDYFLPIVTVELNDDPDHSSETTRIGRDRQLRSRDRDNSLRDAAAGLLAARHATPLRFTVRHHLHADQLLRVPRGCKNIHRSVHGNGLEFGDAPGPPYHSDHSALGEIRLHEDNGQELPMHSAHDDRRLGELSLLGEQEPTDHDLLR